MNAPPTMETAHKYVPTPMEATCAHVYLVISLAQIIKVVMVCISEYISTLVIVQVMKNCMRKLD